jgi:6-phosphogluconolactonase
MRQVEIYPDSDQLVTAVVSQAVSLIQDKTFSKVALSGGTAGVKIAAGLINSLSQKKILDKVEFFMADERFVSIDDPHSNLGQIKALIGHSKPNFFMFDLPPESTIEDSVSKANESLGQDFRFDLALMGCGPDGHTASLFPGHEYPEQTVVPETDSPKPPAMRISFGYKVFESSEEVWFAASGADKATAVSQALSDNHELPVGRITGASSTKWFITEELG